MRFKAQGRQIRSNNSKFVKIAEKGYGTFKPDFDSQKISIIPKKISDYSLKENDRVKVTTKKDNTGTKTCII